MVVKIEVMQIYVSLQPCEMNEISSYQLTITPKSL